MAGCPSEQQVATAKDVLAMWRYVKDFVARRLAEPLDDLTSDLVRLAREKPEQLNHFDIVNIVYSMALAGHETTCNTIGSGVLALLRNRDQWQRLIDDPRSSPTPSRRSSASMGRCSTTAGSPRSTPRSAAWTSRPAPRS